MCNLYALRKSAAEVAAHFGVEVPDIQFNAPEESYPGSPGLVVREQDERRVIQSMTWGFPLRLKTMAPTSNPSRSTTSPTSTRTCGSASPASRSGGASSR